MNKLTIESTTLINERKASTYTLEELLAFIDKEESVITRLTKTLAGSKALPKLCKPHDENIIKLIKLIEKLK